jgi:hypothetical protein
VQNRAVYSGYDVTAKSMNSITLWACETWQKTCQEIALFRSASISVCPLLHAQASGVAQAAPALFGSAPRSSNSVLSPSVGIRCGGTYVVFDFASSSSRILIA